MSEIKLKINESDQGGFVLEENGEVLAELRLVIAENVLIAYHTRVSDKLKGQGVGKKLFDGMVDYARQHQLKVIALCPFVNSQFKRHPEMYRDVWEDSIRYTLKG